MWFHFIYLPCASSTVSHTAVWGSDTIVSMVCVVCALPLLLLWPVLLGQELCLAAAQHTAAAVVTVAWQQQAHMEAAALQWMVTGRHLCTLCVA